MKINDLLNEAIPIPTAATLPASGTTADPSAQPGITPQQQLALHQREVQAKKKEIQDQITDLNNQIMDLKKQLAAVK